MLNDYEKSNLQERTTYHVENVGELVANILGGIHTTPLLVKSVVLGVLISADVIVGQFDDSLAAVEDGASVRSELNGIVGNTPKDFVDI